MRADSNSPAGNAASMTSLGVVLAVVGCASIGTGIFWNAIAFVAKYAYGFSQARSFVLYLVMGAVYVVTAFRSHDVTRACEGRLSHRALLVILVFAQSAVCALPTALGSEWALWAAVVGVSFLSALMWPVLESYVSSGRHGHAMRSAISWFNLTWMVSVTLPLLVMPPILEHHARWAIGGFMFLNLANLPLLAFFQPCPGHHDQEMATRHVPERYPYLLVSARMLLPVSYLLNAALSPILPYRLEALHAAVTIETPMAAIWMASRVLLLLVMWRLPFWHGRWHAIAWSAFAMAGGFATAVLAMNLAMMAIGLAVFGFGVGAIYHLALYYGMAVGRAGVDAAGKHEALIGAGYTAGPLAGLIGTVLGGPATIVGVTLAVMSAGCVLAALPWRRERARRRPAMTPVESAP